MLFRSIITLLYPLYHSYVTETEGIEIASDNALFAPINDLQEKGLFPLLLIPKLLIAMTSQLLRPWQPFTDERKLHSMMTGIFVMIDQFWLCVVTIIAWRKKLWRLSNPIIYFVLLFVLITIAAPLNSPRYLFFAYVLMAIVLSSRELQTLGRKKVSVSLPDDAAAALVVTRPGYDPAMARAFNTGSG